MVDFFADLERLRAVSPKFEKNYPADGEGGVNETLAALASLAEKVKAAGNKITSTANIVQNQDQQSADDIRRT